MDLFVEASARECWVKRARAYAYTTVKLQERLTIVHGLKKKFGYNKNLKDLKKEFCCKRTVVHDPEFGQLQGVQRKMCLPFLFGRIL